MRRAYHHGARWLSLLLWLGLAGGCGDDAGGGPMDAGRRPVGSADGGAQGLGDGAVMPGTDDAATPKQDAALDAGPRVCAVCDGRCEEALSLAPAVHVSGPIDYPDRPPAGGPHGPCWADYLPYLAGAVPPEEWVHNLEHGAVVFLYHCPDDCDEALGELVELTLQLPRVLLTEYTDMPAGFAAVSWGHRLVTSCFDATAFVAFHAEHYDRAPESVSSGRPGGC